MLVLLVNGGGGGGGGVYIASCGRCISLEIAPQCGPMKQIDVHIWSTPSSYIILVLYTIGKVK